MFQNHSVLFVSWRGPRTRLIHPVGRLAFDPATGHFEFRYIRCVEKAFTDGFSPFPEFPTLDAVYRSTQLFPLFSNRVMPASRPGYASFLQSLGLGVAPAHPMAILARTGGRRETDQIELFPSPEMDAHGCYSTHWLLRSVQYMLQPTTEERIARLVPGEVLEPRPEPENGVDPNAIAVWTTDGTKIGYLPAYLAFDFRRLKQDCTYLQVFVSRVNPPPAEAHHRLLCRLVSCWPEGFHPFSDDVFRPISPLAVTV